MVPGPLAAHICEAGKEIVDRGQMEARFPRTITENYEMKRKSQQQPRTNLPYTADIRSVPTHEEIAALAESLWRENGFPQGRDEDTWLEAERQLSRLSDPAGAERDRSSIADPNLGFNGADKGLMEELDERFPGPTGKETTSL